MADANANAALTAAQVEKSIRQVEMRLARQKSAIADSEAHLAALRSLQGKTK